MIAQQVRRQQQVKRHVQSILGKLGTENRTAAASTLLATEEFLTKANEGNKG